MQKRSLGWILGLSLIFAPCFVKADGTLLGTIAGKVVDERGGALPGATVELTSQDKGFGRSMTTDSAGNFQFALLQPGPYTVKIRISGFETFVAKDNIVVPDKTTNVAATLKLARVAETVVVSGETPLVDKTNTSDTTVIPSELTDKVPVGRSYQSVIVFAPGLTDPIPNSPSGGNPNSHGALRGNNVYLFDGVDTTDVTTGTFGQNFNFEAMQEVAVSTTGISAEYGRAQGAVVNVVTKSGTNRFAGSVKVLWTNDSWNAQNKGNNAINGATFAREKTDSTVPDYNYTLGGPFWQDHLWFFGTYETVKAILPAVQTQVSSAHPDETGQSAVPVEDTRLWVGKLTFQLTPSHLLTGQFNSDPISGFINDYWGASAELQALTSQAQNKCGGVGCLKQGSWSGVFGSKVTGEARYAEQSGNIVVSPLVGHGSPFFSFSDNLYYNGATFDGIVDRPRKQANLAFSIFQDIGGSTHQIKLGVDYQDLKSIANFDYPTDTLYYVADFDPANRANPVFQVGDIRQNFISGPSVSTGKIWGGYALDKFSIGNHWSFNVGLRIENQTSKSDLGQSVINTTNVSPRVTAIYDIAGNGKSLLSAAYGRYYQFLVQAIADSIFAGVPQESNYDQFIYDGTQFVFDKSVRAGGNNTVANTDLSPSYIDEFNVAFQQQVGNTMAFGIRGIYRKTTDIVDDAKFLNPDGTLFQTPANFAQAQRYYKGVELTFDKRFSEHWQMLANYTLSRATGNQFNNSQYTSQLFDFPGSTCTLKDAQGHTFTQACTDAEIHNQYGLAPYDRTHLLNVLAAYTMPLGPAVITAAPVFNYQSGLPYQRQRTSLTPIGSTYTYFYDPRGVSRTPSTYELDFSLEAVFRPIGNTQVPLVAGPIELGVRGEIFNVTNQQKVFRSDLVSTTPNFNLSNPFQYYGQPVSRDALQVPRTYRVTALVRF
ncbi:MAG TPA: TonB-dependent receptor [Thermoanaerobaculia bacterium]